MSAVVRRGMRSILCDIASVASKVEISPSRKFFFESLI